MPGGHPGPSMSQSLEASQPHSSHPGRGNPHKGTTPYDAMMSGIQLQGLVAQMASKQQGSAGGSPAAGTEVVKPGVTELTKLPPATPEAALHWLHAVKPSMSDLSDSSAVCWESVLAEARRWYNSSYVPASPLQRLRLKLPGVSPGHGAQMGPSEAQDGALGFAGVSRWSP